jgi:two-component system chemotaxis response regulator CheB
MRASLHGRLEDFEMHLVLSMLEMGQVTGRLELRSPEYQGMLGFRSGIIVSAELGGLLGEPAALQMLAMGSGKFSFTRCEVGEERSIHSSNQSLLLEAQCLLAACESGEISYERVKYVMPESLDEVQKQILNALEDTVELGEIARTYSLSPLIMLYYLEQLEEVGAVSRCECGKAVTAEAVEKKLRILLVDDSRLMQKVMRRLYESDPGVEVVGIAENGEQALYLLSELRPDVISLDLYLPEMDGVATLKRIMLSQPTPTVIVTSPNPEDLDLTFESMHRYGAVDFVTKPAKQRGELDMQADSIIHRMHTAARANLRGISMIPTPPRPVGSPGRGESRAIVVASGGNGACLSFMQLLTAISADLPISIVGLLELPAAFMEAFTRYLRRCTALEVRLASHGAPLLGGVCYLAVSGSSLRLVEAPNGPVLEVDGDEKRTPSRIFLDAAEIFGEHSVALLLSGQGDKELPGLTAIRAAGGVTMAQLPESCVDPEQPRQALELDVIDQVVLLPLISSDLSRFLMDRLRRGSAGSIRRRSPEQ